MKRYVLASLAAIVGYIVGAFCSYFLVGWFSPNPHDRSVEAAMSAAFVYGPLTAVLAFVVTLVSVRASPPAPR